MGDLFAYVSLDVGRLRRLVQGGRTNPHADALVRPGAVGTGELMIGKIEEGEAGEVEALARVARQDARIGSGGWMRGARPMRALARELARRERVRNKAFDLMKRGRPAEAEDLLLPLTLDEDPTADYDGIKRINALKWLMGEV